MISQEEHSPETIVLLSLILLKQRVLALLYILNSLHLVTTLISKSCNMSAILLNGTFIISMYTILRTITLTMLLRSCTRDGTCGLISVRGQKLFWINICQATDSLSRAQNSHFSFHTMVIL